MSAEECRRFLALPHAREAILLRRWDDRANREPVAGLPFARFKALAQRLACGRGESAG
jgi:predicted HD phosphohydrolase